MTSKQDSAAHGRASFLLMALIDRGQFISLPRDPMVPTSYIEAAEFSAPMLSTGYPSWEEGGGFKALASCCTGMQESMAQGHPRESRAGKPSAMHQELQGWEA